MVAAPSASEAGPMPVLDTARLRLRPFFPDDLDDLAAMVGDREVTAQTFLGYRTREQASALLDDYVAGIAERGWGMWTIRDRATDQFLGEAGLVPTPFGAPGLRYALIKPAWGNGYATEAALAVIGDFFGRVGFDRMVAGVKPASAASRRILEKLGFLWEREITDHGPPSALMRLAAEDWRGG